MKQLLSPALWLHPHCARPQFLREHLAMANVRLYARDALRLYASLQRFTPVVQPGGSCITGARLLEMFGSPNRRDRDMVLDAYKW